VRRWSAFPAGAPARPLVMVGGRVFPERGFRTSEAKLAFLCGCIDWAVDVPDGVRTRLARHDAGSRPHRPVAPLVITAADRGEYAFRTDRGRRQLPAWRLLADDAAGPIWVLDPEIGEWRPVAGAGEGQPDLPAPIQDPGVRLDVAGDDRTVTLHWLGAAVEYERYPTAEAVESGAAVSLVARGQDTGWPGPRRAIGHVHQVPATLRAPLGNRVFVDLHGHAGEVTLHDRPASR